MKKKIIWSIAAIVLLLSAGAGIVFSGALTRPTRTMLDSDTIIPNIDIIALQNQREQEILQDYQAGTYTLKSPYVIQDPYSANPLSAMIIFETDQPAEVSITVTGKDDYTTFSYTYPEPGLHHEIAVLGLYPDTHNTILLQASYSAGDKDSASITLQTEPLPYDFPILSIQTSIPELMEPGVNLMIPCFETNYTYMLDARGDVRAYFSNKNFGHGTAMRILQNDRLLATGDIMKIMPYNMYTLWEMNFLGKVFVEYDIPNAIHHDVIELANGDFLAASSNANMPLKYDTREDVAVQINRQTGLVTAEYDLRKILDENRKPYNHFDPGIQNQLNIDWMHMNSVAVDPTDDSLIASSPIQSAVVKFDRQTGEIHWILSSPEGWNGQFSRFQQYLLTPTGSADFEWQWGQHAVSILPDSDNNPDTLDLLMLDNGQARSFLETTSIKPENNYSRAVIYRIDQSNMTVEQLWEYGKLRGSEAYSTFLGNADYLPQTGNINISFGGMLRNDGVPVDDIIQGVLGSQEIHSRVVEVQSDGKVVFDVLATPNHTSSAETYQVRRVSLYSQGIGYHLGEVPGLRKGVIQSADQVDTALPRFFLNHISPNFNQIFESNGFLILQGNFQYDGKSYLLGRANFVLRSTSQAYQFQSGAGLNGNFYARINLNELPPGEYALYVIGGVVDGLDAKGKIKPGYNPTGYKITVK